MKAVWNDTIIAESDSTINIEGNHYFPPESVNMTYFSETTLHTTCPWKGLASYFTITVEGKEFENGAWYYPQPKDEAGEIKGYIAFYP